MTPKRPKILCLTDDGDMIDWIEEWGYKQTFFLGDADAVFAFGGEHINPSLYKQLRHPEAKGHNIPRDQRECLLLRLAMRANIPLIGICRGAQLLHALNGGQIAQKVDGHTTDHNIVDVATGNVMTASSTHTQAMIPEPQNEFLVHGCEVLAWANETTEREWMEQRVKVTQKVGLEWSDAEVIQYPQTKSLCFQPHPEFEGYSDLTLYFWERVEEVMEL